MKHISNTIACLMERARSFHQRKSIPNPFDDLPQLRGLHENLKTHQFTPEHFTSRVQLLHHEKANWRGTHFALIEFYSLLYKQLRKNGYPVYCHTAYRHPKLQAMLQRQGNSLVNSGPHQRGAAIDLVHSHFHWNAHRDFWRLIGNMGEHIIRQRNLPLEWGGRWSNFPDPAHWQIKHWRDLPKLEHAKTIANPLVKTPTGPLKLTEHGHPYQPPQELIKL